MHKIFINLSNHASAQWSEAQTAAAKKYGEIIDLPFPQVPVNADHSALSALADKTFAEAMAMQPACVMCTGEPVLTFLLVDKFLNSGIKIVAACTERIAHEYTDESGKTHKNVLFDFAGFREYFRQ